MRQCNRLIIPIIAVLCLNVGAISQSNDRFKEIEQELRSLDDGMSTRPYSQLPKVDALRSESEALENVPLMVLSYYVMSKAYGARHEYDLAYESINKAFTIATDAQFDSMDYRLNYRKGLILLEQGKYLESIEFFKISQAITAAKGDRANQARAVMFIGNAYTKSGDFDKAIASLNEATKILRETNDAEGLQNLYSYMGAYYFRKGDRQKALEQNKKALDLSIERKDTSWMITNHLNLIAYYALVGQTDMALAHYEERDKLIKAIEYPEDRKIELNIGVLYVQTEQYDRALEVFNICQDYYRKEGNAYRVALIDHWKAIAYRGLDRYDLAADRSMAAYEGANNSNDKVLAELSAFTLFQTYHWRGKDTEAIKWLLTSGELKDSLRYEAKQKEMIALETKYETFRKEQEIEILKAKSETERVKRNQLWLGFISSLLIGAMLVYNQILRRRKEKEIQLQKLKNSELETEKLKDKLHYKEKEMATQLLQMAQKNEFLAHINSSLDSIKSDADNENKFRLQKVIRMITRDISSNETWDQFLTSFKEIHHTFIDTLVKNYRLTANEIRLASMMKMNMSSKEVASLLNVSDEGVKKARYRLRKKLGLESHVNIQEYFLSLR
jgi:tetratricopeptide (TPR) repeat protein/DNA-binding CsgD family transcriptional regulator